MNKIIFLLFVASAFIALNHVQCTVHVVTKYEYVTAEPEVHETVVNKSVESSDRDEIHIKLNIPGVTQIINAALTIVAKLLRTAINIIRPISPHGAAALDSILDRLENAVENLTSVGGISILIKELIGIVQDAIKGVEGILKDVSGDAASILQKLLGALKGLLAGLHVVQPAAKIASRISG